MANSINNSSRYESRKKTIPYFQPIVGAASGTIIGYEALARQHDAEGGLFQQASYFLHRILRRIN